MTAPGSTPPCTRRTRHAPDAARREVTWIEQVPGAPEWARIRDRVRRAATAG